LQYIYFITPKKKHYVKSAVSSNHICGTLHTSSDLISTLALTRIRRNVCRGSTQKCPLCPLTKSVESSHPTKKKKLPMTDSELSTQGVNREFLKV